MKIEGLVLSAKQGDADAMETVVQTYKPTVKQIARGYFLLGADQEDLIQEGMLGLFRAVNEYDPAKGARFGTFARTCVTRQMLSAIERSTAQKHRPLNDAVSLSAVEEQEAVTGDPLAALLQNEQASVLQEWLNNVLTPLERKTVSLFLQGYGYDEIARKLGKNVKSVDNALHRARTKLERLPH